MLAIIQRGQSEYITRVSVRLTGTFRSEERVHKFWRDVPTVDAKQLVEATRSKVKSLDYHEGVIYLFQWERMNHLCDMR